MKYWTENMVYSNWPEADAVFESAEWTLLIYPRDYITTWSEGHRWPTAQCTHTEGPRLITGCTGSFQTHKQFRLLQQAAVTEAQPSIRKLINHQKSFIKENSYKFNISCFSKMFWSDVTDRWINNQGYGPTPTPSKRVLNLLKMGPGLVSVRPQRHLFRLWLVTHKKFLVNLEECDSYSPASQWR